jgi:hypothetical protein
MSITETLRRLNRKERYWVVRTALGDPSRTLDGAFCKALEEKLNDRDVSVDVSTAWWAMDYHFNWLFAALQVHCGKTNDGAPAWDNASGAVQGNQEDIDLVVASGNDIILVEAKNGSWSSDQLRSKIERLKLLKADDDGCVGEGDRRIRLHLVLMSPKDANRGELGRLLEHAPAWMRRGDANAWRWLELQIDDPAPDWKVHRSNESGRKDKAGSYWTIAGK